MNHTATKLVPQHGTPSRVAPSLSRQRYNSARTTLVTTTPIMIIIIMIGILIASSATTTSLSRTTTTTVGSVFALSAAATGTSSSSSSSSSHSSSRRSRTGRALNLSQQQQQQQQQPQDDDTTATTRQYRTVLVTGGAGYIGSHTCLELLLHQPSLQSLQSRNSKDDNSNNNNENHACYRVIVVDNLDNSSEESLRRVRQLLMQQQQQQQQSKLSDEVNVDTDTDDFEDRLIFRQCDIRDRDGLESILQEFPDISSCIHFAGLKAVGESVTHPLRYYDCNVAGTISLLQLLQQYQIRNFVFSSSATVYGEPEQLPITENAKLQATNPYGRTKLFIEEILRDCYASAPSFWNALILRYFNPIGAHPSGRIGEDPQGIPNNLMPFIAQVCVGRRKELSIFGDDYPTPDGTGVRDYIHVVDLAKGHVAALEALYTTPNLGCRAVNLGTGKGVSVLELVEGMRRATGTAIPYVIGPRRPGDVATVYADPSTAQQLLRWTATLDVDDMCADTWKWQSMNPYGYQLQQEETIVNNKENENEQVLELTETK